MRFVELLERADIPQYRLLRGDPEVTSIACDSRRCRRGCCFVAVRGSNDDGHKYIPQAIAAGSVAVVCEDPSGVGGDLACAAVPDSKLAAGRLAQALLGWPARSLTCIGVTGTNGKTTVTYLLRSILAKAGISAGLLGTIDYHTVARSIRAGTTTPGPVELADLTAEMVSAGATHLVMEVSSHALDQHRTAGLEFQAAVFTNITGDHLDYHGTMQRYRQAKLRMFRQLNGDALAVINRDDPAGEVFAAATSARVRWYGLNPAADVWAKIERIDTEGTQFTMFVPGRQVAVHTPLIGRHNVYNCLAAAAAALDLNVDVETIASAIASMKYVPGRLQRVAADAPYKVFVDYAHSDDALANVLGSLRPLTAGRIILVFGCGGDRDPSKRPRMAKVAEELADGIVVTSDNPRSEDPAKIIDQIVAGLTAEGRSRCVIHADRREAIRAALGQARAGDVVLIAGKGHEDYQQVGTRRLPFDDAQVAAELVRQEGVRR